MKIAPFVSVNVLFSLEVLSLLLSSNHLSFSFFWHSLIDGLMLMKRRREREIVIEFKYIMAMTLKFISLIIDENRNVRIAMLIMMKTKRLAI